MSYYTSNPQPPKERSTGVIIAIIVMILAVGVLGWVIAVSLDTGIGNNKAPEAATPLPTATQPRGFLPEETPQSTEPVATLPAVTAVPKEARPEELPPFDGHTLTYSDLMSSVADIVETVTPSVVSVTNQVKKGMEYKDSAYGSGVILSTEGYIVTNAHVVQGAAHVVVTLAGGKEYDAEILGSDAKTDIAVLRIQAEGLTAISVGNSADLRVGDLAIAIGNALSLDLSTASATAGIVSALDRTVVANNWPSDMIQTNAAINPGNSGGALVNGRGELVGICARKEFIAGFSDYGTTLTAEGIGYAISTKEMLPVVNDLILYGMVRRPTIGITGQEVTEDSGRNGQYVTGVYCTGITANSGATAAGLQVGDIITAVDEKPVEKLSDINGVIKTKKVDDLLHVTYWRNGQTHETDVKLGIPAT